MLVAANKQGDQVLAWRAGEDTHYCPECLDPVFLKDGPLKIAHFSHYPESRCGYGTGEGARHVALKAMVMEAFEAFEEVAFEKVVIPNRRCDVVVPSARVVVECQASAIDSRDWFARTQEYSHAGYSVLWVWDLLRLDMEYTPKEVLLCHRHCYGQITACDPETAQWYSVHLDSRNEYGYYMGRRRRLARLRELPENTKLLRARNADGLKIVNLTKPWWTTRHKTQVSA